MTTIDRALLEQALDALECCYSQKYDGAKLHGAKAALRDALSAQPAKPLFADLIAQHEGLAEELAAMNGPAWHDAPTCAGLWANDEAVWSFQEHELHSPRKDGRWCGPLPEDTK